MRLVQQSLPLLALTMGDPAGIGPEVIVRALQDTTVFDKCRPFVIGAVGAIRLASTLVGSNLIVQSVDDFQNAGRRPGQIDVLELPGVDVTGVVSRRLSAQAGNAAVTWARKGAELAFAGEIAGVVTAPVNKEAVTLVGHAAFD